MKYPAVFRDTNTSSSGDSNQQTVLIYQDGDAIHLTGKFKGQYTARWSTFNAINITHEYLANTYGEVVSPEHAEFIIKLAKNAGFGLNTGTNENYPCWFAFDDELYFFDSKVYASDDSRKQITIPLPPKSDINEAGHNLVFAANECKEWPCVNDKVSYNNGISSGVVIGIHDDAAWIKMANGNMDIALISQLKKPKTPEEALRDEVTEVIWKANEQWGNSKGERQISVQEFVAIALLTKYNITPKEV